MSWLYPNALPITMSLTAYNAFLTGLMVLLRRRDKSGLYYFISSFIIFLWGVGISFMLNNQLPIETAQFWGRFSQIAALFIPPTWLHFVLSYTGLISSHRKWLYAAYATAFLIFPFTFGPSFVAGFKSAVGIRNYPVPGPAFAAFTVFFVVVIIFSFWIFIQKAMAAPSKHKREDYLRVSLASLYGFGSGSFTFLPVFGILMPQWNLIFMPIWQILLTYAMIRYRAFDAEELAQVAHRDKLAAMGTLASSMNHEVRSPLFVARGIADTYLTDLEEGIYKDPQQAIQQAKESFSKMTQQIQRASDIMKNFSSFAKQNIAENFHFERVNLKQVLDAVIPLVKYELERDEVKMEMDISSEIHVQADTRHLEEIFFNLIVNACQAMKHTDLSFPRKRESIIKIAASEQPQKVIVTVADNGPGIPEEHIKNVFKPFYTTKEDGTGLGLFITKQLIDRCRGHISVESQLGCGTTFTLKFKQ